MKLYLATFISRHFHFDAFERKADEAKLVLIATLHQHARDYGIDNLDWFNADDIDVREIEIGRGYRDHEPVKMKET